MPKLSDHCILPYAKSFSFAHLCRGCQKPSFARKMQILEMKIGTLQSSYTRAINIQEKRTGALFQPKCKALEVRIEHAPVCFHYIHKNPLKAGLCRSLEAWRYSSFNEYLDSETYPKSICTRDVAHNMLGISRLKEHFFIQSSKDIIEENIIDIFIK